MALSSVAASDVWPADLSFPSIVKSFELYPRQADDRPRSSRVAVVTDSMLLR
jgi:hypothetical protein